MISPIPKYKIYDKIFVIMRSMATKVNTNIPTCCISLRSMDTKVDTNKPAYCISMRSMATKINTNIPACCISMRSMATKVQLYPRIQSVNGGNLLYREEGQGWRDISFIPRTIRFFYLFLFR